jgi:hypothetical protein
VFRTQAAGKDRSKTLGTYPELSLSEAREAARVIAGKGLTKLGTLGELLEAYRDSLTGRASFGDVKSSIETNKHPLYGAAARDILPADIAAILRVVAARGALVRMNRFRAMLSAAFSFGAKRDNDPLAAAGAVRFRITSNPVALVPKFGDEKPRDRILTDAELAAYYLAAKQRGAAGKFLQLQLLTGQRLIQLAAAVRDGDTLIVTDRKGRGGKVKINVLPILAEWADLVDEALLVGRHLGIATLRKAAGELLPATANALDLRRTIETRLLRLGVSREDRGFLLSHGKGEGGVQAKHYERDDRLPMKRMALQMWCDTLEKISEGCRKPTEK